MNAQQLIKQGILIVVDRWQEYGKEEEILAMNGDQVDEAYEESECGDDCDYIQDARSEFREGQVETDIASEYSRHYESNSVAACVNGQWVGWTYWYGGGKHGEPEAIDWIEYAYLLDCVEEQKVVTVRNFTKKGDQE